MPPRKRPADAPAPRAKRLAVLADSMRDMMAAIEAMDEVPPYGERAAVVALFHRLRAAMHPLVAAAPPLPDDIVVLILEHAQRHRTMARFGGHGSVVPSRRVDRRLHRPMGMKIHSLRLVCRQWARCGGQIVHRITTPSLRHVSAASVFSAFPHACRLDLDASCAFYGDAGIAWAEALIAAYMARAGRPLTVYINDLHDRLNLSGAFMDSYDFDGFSTVVRNIGAPVPIDVRPSGRLHATQVSDPWTLGESLARADVVWIAGIRNRTLACNFRARKVKIGYKGEKLAWDARAIRYLFDPVRWVGGQLPFVTLICDASELRDLVKTLVLPELRRGF